MTYACICSPGAMKREVKNGTEFSGVLPGY